MSITWNKDVDVVPRDLAGSHLKHLTASELNGQSGED